MILPGCVTKRVTPLGGYTPPEKRWAQPQKKRPPVKNYQYQRFQRASIPMDQTEFAKFESDVPAIKRASKVWGVPEFLILAIMRTECNQWPNKLCISHTGAVGPMQLMPGTARRMGVDPYDRAENIYGGTRYLRQLIDRYPGDLTAAIMAYHAGEGNIDQLMARYGDIPTAHRAYKKGEKQGAVGYHSWRYYPKVRRALLLLQNYTS